MPNNNQVNITLFRGLKSKVHPVMAIAILVDACPINGVLIAETSLLNDMTDDLETDTTTLQMALAASIGGLSCLLLLGLVGVILIKKIRSVSLLIPPLRFPLICYSILGLQGDIRQSPIVHVSRKQMRMLTFRHL